LGNYQNITAETSPGIALKSPIRNLASQVLHFSLTGEVEDQKKSENQEEWIEIHVDGFRKKIPVFVADQSKFVAFFDQSIFCSTWKGIFWNKAPSIVNKENIWIDAAVFQKCFTCDIDIRKEKLWICFDGKILEADLNSPFYIYENSSGQRYMREGKLWISNESDSKMINADIFCEEADMQRKDIHDGVYYTGQFIT
jgi:hypothetical protein